MKGYEKMTMRRLVRDVWGIFATVQIMRVKPVEKINYLRYT
jgi:hypothetical protein